MPPTGGPSGIPGCCGCVSGGLSGQVCFTVKGCPGFTPALLPGADVTVTRAGVTIGTGTTDGSGVACISLNGQIVSTFSYSISKSPYTTATGTFGWAGGTANVARTLGHNATTHICLCQGPDLVEIPSTIYISDGSNSIALSGNVGCHTYSGIPNVRKLDGTIGTGSVPVQFNTDLDSCGLTLSWPLDEDGSCRPREANCTWTPPTCSVIVPRTSTSSSPLLVVYSLTVQECTACGTRVPPFDPSGTTFSVTP